MKSVNTLNHFEQSTLTGFDMAKLAGRALAHSLTTTVVASAVLSDTVLDHARNHREEEALRNQVRAAKRQQKAVRTRIEISAIEAETNEWEASLK